ncbi:MAG: hypothetical protein FWC09_03100 [Lachnospiraceae bacterium]|nr:hypothetical protein [Lachnospiraceae bacterium]
MVLYKKWCLLTVSIVTLSLFLIASLTVFIDPFFHYHKPHEWLSYRFGDQNYVNPGIVRNFDYDAIIIGTSMSENFKPSLFSQLLGENAVKVPYSGGKTKNFNALLELAFKSNDEIKSVYMGLDLNMLIEKNASEAREPFPEHLFDNNPFNDASYLLNKNVLLRNTVPFIVNTLAGKPSETFDGYSYWIGDGELAYGNFINEFDFNDYFETKIRPINSWPGDVLLASVRENLQLNIVPLVESYPQSEFIFFFPPYSILYWFDKDTDDIAAVIDDTIKTLIHYDNVRLFLPMNDPDIVANIYNYRDAGHYSPDINDYLVSCFKDGTYLLTPDNYQEELRKLTDMVNEFDYTTLINH